MVKVVRSNRDGEDYEKFDENGQNLGLFWKLIQNWGICAQYTMPGSPHQNKIVKRQNHTLMGVVRSMLSYNIILISLWINALMTATYLLNRVPTEEIEKIPYELLTWRKPTLPNKSNGI